MIEISNYSFDRFERKTFLEELEKIQKFLLKSHENLVRESFEIFLKQKMPLPGKRYFQYIRLSKKQKRKTI